MNPAKPILALVFIAAALISYSQDKSIYQYQQLSHLYYQKQKDSLKKAWACPVVYNEKNVQKQYREIWDQRSGFVIEAIENDNYIRDNNIYTYVSGIVDQVVAANKSLIPVKPFLLIDRSAAVNAYALGKDIIVVNLGLVAFAKSREDIALVIAHELSHNILNHAESAMRQRAEWLESDEYKNSLNDVLKSKYERLSKLKKAVQTYKFNRNMHQRYKESDADSLAIILLKKSSIPFEAELFLRLDSADNYYRKPLKNAVQSYFTAYNLKFDESWSKKRSKGLSSRTYNFADTTSLQDSLKTHPDCSERYAKTLAQSTVNPKLSPVPASVTDNANKMIIWNLFSNMNLTQCLYRILLEKDKGKTDPWYDFMTHNVITGLYYSDKQLKRFKAIGVTQKEYISKNYYELQTSLEQIPRETLEEYCTSLGKLDFWSRVLTDEKQMKELMQSLALETDSDDKKISKIAKTFTDSNPSSMYCEFANNFKTK